MGAEPLTRPAIVRYDDDFVQWAEETARLLRERRFDEIDLENLVEEVEAMAGRDKRELTSRLTVLLQHLLKWQHQPGKRSRSWRVTVVRQRAEIRTLLEQSPSLRRQIAKSMPRAYSDAVQLAYGETGLPPKVFPSECPFSIEQVLDENFFAEQ